VIVIKTDSGYVLQHKGMEVEVNRHAHVRDSFACKALDELLEDIENLEYNLAENSKNNQRNFK